MLVALLVGATFAVVRGFSVDPDMWWHIRTGELILSTHHWATTDPYSYTAAGAPWMSCEWLGDVVFAVVYRVGGLRGLEALLVVLASAVMLALYGFATLRSGNCKAAFVVSGVLLVLAAASFNLRPQMLGYLFLILTLIALELFRQGKQRAVWLLPMLFLLWVNTHGSWIVGLATVALFFGAGLVSFQVGSLEARRWTSSERLRLEVVFLLSLVAIPITPYGARLAAYPFTVASTLPISVANILEWQVMPFNLGGGKLFLALVLGFFLAQVALRFSWRARGNAPVSDWHGVGLHPHTFPAAVCAVLRAAGCDDARALLACLQQAQRPIPAQFGADGGCSASRWRITFLPRQTWKRKSPHSFPSKPCNICARTPYRARFSIATALAAT